MLEVQTFTFLPQAFAENTYVVGDGAGSCVVIDPGCYTASEQSTLSSFIEDKGWTVEGILLTHAHIDHICGLRYVHERFKAPIYAHKDELFNLERAADYAGFFGFSMETPPMPEFWIDEGDELEWGGETFRVLFTPGHSPGHVSFHHLASNRLFSGDVIFRDSFGRTDLPGGNLETLRETILQKVLMLPEETQIYAGHLGPTTVGRERKSNPMVTGF